jgi:hypothetical protein
MVSLTCCNRWNKEQVGRAFAEFKNPVDTMDELIEETKRGNCREMTL